MPAGVLMAQPDHEQINVQQLYERYGRAVLRRCQYFLRNDADAKDAMHDVFVKVAVRKNDFRGQSSPLTWMVRIATNHCLNILRSRRAAWKDRYQETVNVGSQQHQGHDDRLQRRQLLHTLLGTMDRKTQEAAIYYFVDEMTQEDAAHAAQCSVPTLRKRLRAFIRKARQGLKNIDADLVFKEPPV